MGKKCCKSRPLCKDCPKRKKNKAKGLTDDGKADFRDLKSIFRPQDHRHRD